MNRRLWTMLLALRWCLPLLTVQVDYAGHIAPLTRKLYKAGLLSNQGLKAVEAAAGAGR